MAAFRGVYTAPELRPTPCGLLSVANVKTHTSSDYDERWVRGFSYEFDSLATTRILTTNDDAVTGGELYNSLGQQYYRDYSPFFIEVELTRSTLGLPAQDRFAIALKQLEAATQKAVELELWDGVAAKAASNTNLFLSKQGAAAVPNTGAYSASDALFHLEQAIASSPTGASGVIHMTRDVASILGSKIVYASTDGGKTGKAMTRLGTEVAIGSGYSGVGPYSVTGASASATNRWMYATGPVEVHLSKSEIVNDTLSQGINANINDMVIKAVRSAAVYFDPSIHFAVRVAVPALA
jgi:hypothetical protein